MVRPIAVLARVPGTSVDRAFVRRQLGTGWRIEEAEDSSAAFRMCLEGRVERLYLPMTSVTASRLTAVSLLRRMRPGLHVVLLAERDLGCVLQGVGIADEVQRLDRPRPSRRLRGQANLG